MKGDQELKIHKDAMEKYGGIEITDPGNMMA